MSLPVYEYRCGSCQRRSTRLFKTLAAVAIPDCPYCGQRALERLISRPTLLRGNAVGRDDHFAGPDEGMAEAIPDMESGNPRSLARMTRQMSEEMGEDIPGEYEGVLRRMEAGEMPADEEIDAIEADVGGEPSYDD